MAKQTAVEYLMEQLKFTNKEAYAELHCNGEFEKAKQMEKEQLEKFYLLGDKDGFESCYYHNSNCLDFEQYYNETYNW
jgi:hypothetical protein